MAIVDMLPHGGTAKVDPDILEFKFGSSGQTYTVSETYTNVLVQLGIGGSSSYQNITYSVEPDKVLVLKHHSVNYWGTWLFYETLPANTQFTIGNSGGYPFMTIVKIGK